MGDFVEAFAMLMLPNTNPAEWSAGKSFPASAADLLNTSKAPTVRIGGWGVG